MCGHASGAQRTRARHVTKFVLCSQLIGVKRMIDPILDAAAAAAGAAAADAIANAASLAAAAAATA